VATAWVYIDESQAPHESIAEPGRPFRVGCLLVEKEITNEIVNQAWATFTVDPDVTRGNNRLDRKTLARGYFHASADGKNAHSALCTAIVSAGLNAAFKDSQWHFDVPGSTGRTEAHLHGLANALAIMSLLDQDYDEVRLLIATRSSFDSTVARGWLADSLEKRLHSQLVNPWIPTRFPPIAVDFVGADHPGIQVCDFMLWAVQRAQFPEALAQPDADGRLRRQRVWLERMGLRHFMSVNMEGDPQRSSEYVLGNAPFRPFTPKTVGARTLDTLGTQSLTEGIIQIEHLIREQTAMGKPIPNRLAQHGNDLLRSAERLSKARLSLEDVLLVARTFLLICDTLPVYEVSDEEQCRRACELKAIAIGVCDQLPIRWIRMADHWSYVHSMVQSGQWTVTFTPAKRNTPEQV